MIKRMMLLAVSVAALVAFAVPAAAQATPLVHDENEEAANSVTAVSENTITTLGAGKFDCATWKLSINLTENTTTTAVGAGAGEAFGTPSVATHTPGEHCAGPAEDTTVSDVTVTAIHLGTGGTGHVSFVFKYSILPGCTVDGTADLTYTPGSSSLSLVNSTLTGTPATFPCILMNGGIVGDFILQNGVTIG